MPQPRDDERWWTQSWRHSAFIGGIVALLFVLLIVMAATD